jgi:hypothetical protein
MHHNASVVSSLPLVHAGGWMPLVQQAPKRMLTRGPGITLSTLLLDGVNSHIDFNSHRLGCVRRNQVAVSSYQLLVW